MSHIDFTLHISSNHLTLVTVTVTFASQCAEKPADDYYGFTHFARDVLNSCKGGINPLPSDSRRRPDRALLELGNSSGEREGEGECVGTCLRVVAG
jgi:hypothetical protein